VGQFCKSPLPYSFMNVITNTVSTLSCPRAR
jgi:hypothetical protein